MYPRVESNDSRYNMGVLYHTHDCARLRVTTYVTYLSSHGGATIDVISRVLFHTPCARLRVTRYIAYSRL